MFYIWHTLLISVFIALAYLFGYKHGMNTAKKTSPKDRRPLSY
jgi:hypothetical protein